MSFNTIQIQNEIKRKNSKNILTSRQLECLSLLAFGLNNCEIGKLLIVSESTVKKTLGEIFRKLKAKDRVSAITLAFIHGILSLESLNTYCEKYSISLEFERY